MYLSKTDPSIFLGEMEYKTPAQAYIIHSVKQGLGSDVSLWDRQSNTFGIVMAAAQAKSVHGISMRPYPLLCENNVVMMLAKNITIPQTFAELSLRCLTRFVSDDSKKLYVCVASGLKFLKSKAKGDRATVRHVGRACGEIEHMVNSSVHRVSLSNNDLREAHVKYLESKLFPQKTVFVPRQLLQNCDAPGDNSPDNPYLLF